MTRLAILAVAIAALAFPAVAQTTTTVTTEQQPPPPPPPPQPPSTQVVVNPQEPDPAPPPPRRRVRVDTDSDVTSVEAPPSGRNTVAIIATDALYGGVAGGLIGGGVTLIDQGDHWQRNLMVGAGIGVLAGAAFGIYEAAVQPAPTVVRRAAADRNPAANNAPAMQVALLGTRF